MRQGAAELEYVWQETHQALIEAAYAEPTLRALYPFTSHWALRFSTTIRHAFLDELAHGKALNESNGSADSTFHGITAPVARMLDWLIGHHPQVAPRIIGEIIGDAERRLDIPRDVTAEPIRTALGLDSQLPRQARLEFLAVRCPHLPRLSLARRLLRLPHPWNSVPGVGSHARNAVASLLPDCATFQGSRFAVASGVVL
ncbi:DUF6193 family natural product biosynthesis protein [Streptomyces sp. NPDC017966]|uniref:DUF6193 family natural product biosynthesis protein n=1 Tax=Streptomyces sp. NPDC017966 TaxID=3365023 RepID=UPI0037A52C67